MTLSARLMLSYDVFNRNLSGLSGRSNEVAPTRLENIAPHARHEK